MNERINQQIQQAIKFYSTKVKQVAQLSQRDHSAWWVSYGKKCKTGTGRQYFADIIGLSSPEKQWNSMKKNTK